MLGAALSYIDRHEPVGRGVWLNVGHFGFGDETGMDDSKRRKVTIDETLFSLAFNRDVDFHDTYPVRTFLDLKTGEISWVYEDDQDAYMETGVEPDENRMMRERVESAPTRYLEVPGLDHGGHHEILRAFLDSEWTADEEQHTRARMAYSGSIGGWKESLDDESIVHAFHDYRDRTTIKMAEEFLRENGIEPEWR